MDNNNTCVSQVECVLLCASRAHIHVQDIDAAYALWRDYYTRIPINADNALSCKYRLSAEIALFNALFVRCSKHDQPDTAVTRLFSQMYVCVFN
jgi:hypothetical protein